MVQLRIELLGTFRLAKGPGGDIPVRSPKLRALIAFLALHLNQPVRRETLASLLWADSPDAQARQSLRQALLSMRKTLGDDAVDVLDVDDETVTFRSAVAHVDVAAFEACVEEGRLEEAAAAYRGDLMEEPAARSDPFDSWIAQERIRLRERACAALEMLVAHLLQTNDPSRAVLAGKQLQALDPWRETGARLLMRAFAQADRRTEALRHYQTFAEIVRNELGAEPDAETTRLFEDIREGKSFRQQTPGAYETAVAPAAIETMPKASDTISSPLSRASNRRRLALIAAVVIIAIAASSIWKIYFREPVSDTDASSKAVVDSGTPDKPSIAVLPFANMSGDPEQEYFADGITEDITSSLSKFGLFSVISRNSTFTYKGVATNVKDVARDLGVRYVVEGSVRKSGDRVRITVQLVDAIADKHIWAERYDQELEDIFQIQDEITQSIVTSVAPEYLSAEMHRAQQKEEQNLDAWDAFMRSYWHFLRFTRDDNAVAQRLLRKAIELDPQQANYHGLMAVTHVMDAFYGWSESRDASFRVALESAERALALDDQDTVALRSMGLVHFFSSNHDVALSYYKRAVTANPNEAENRALLGAALGVAGDYDAALDQFETAFRLSPRDVHVAIWYNYLGIAAFVAGRDDEAAEWARKTVQANPQFPGGHRTLAASYGNLGRIAEAETARGKLQELLPHLTIAQLRESLPYFKKPDDMERYLEGLRKAGLPEEGNN